MPQLICQDLSLGYDGKTVVSDLSFSVNSGDYLCIVGENGSGKSTLMKTLLKLMPPISGQITTGEGLSPNEIGYLPQQTAAQKDFPASVGEVVLSGFLNRNSYNTDRKPGIKRVLSGLRPFYNKSEKQTAKENMRKLGIDGFTKRCYRELSGGQQQRVLLARALCATRKILLLDEPAAGLDPMASAEMYTLITKLNESGATIIMISHDIAASVKYASHILHIGEQGSLFFGTKADYTKSKAGYFFTGMEGEQT